MVKRKLMLCIFLFFFLFITPVSTRAHVGFGEYAGTHAVAFVPQPRSPLVGEEVTMTFYLRDLHGSLASELFTVGAVIQKVLEDDEKNIITLPSETIQSGVYTISHRFAESGLYRVEFTFRDPDVTDIIRDAVFDIEVRDLPPSTSRTTFLTSIFLIILTFATFLVGFLVGRKTDLAARHISGAGP